MGMNQISCRTLAADGSSRSASAYSTRTSCTIRRRDTRPAAGCILVMVFPTANSTHPTSKLHRDRVRADTLEKSSWRITPRPGGSAFRLCSRRVSEGPATPELQFAVAALNVSQFLRDQRCKETTGVDRFSAADAPNVLRTVRCPVHRHLSSLRFADQFAEFSRISLAILRSAGLKSNVTM